MSADQLMGTFPVKIRLFIRENPWLAFLPLSGPHKRAGKRCKFTVI